MPNAFERRKWTRDETILALDLYFKIPFAKVNAHHPEVLKLARIIKRPPASLSMKIGNIGRFDPTLVAQGIVGLAHGAKSEKLIAPRTAAVGEGLLEVTLVGGKKGDCRFSVSRKVKIVAPRDAEKC